MINRIVSHLALSGSIESISSAVNTKVAANLGVLDIDLQSAISKLQNGKKAVFIPITDITRINQTPIQLRNEGLLLAREIYQCKNFLPRNVIPGFSAYTQPILEPIDETFASLFNISFSDLDLISSNTQIRDRFLYIIKNPAKNELSLGYIFVRLPMVSVFKRDYDPRIN